MKKITFLICLLIVLNSFSQENKNDNRTLSEKEHLEWLEFKKNKKNNLDIFGQKQRGTEVRRVKEQSAKYTYKALIIATEKYEDDKFKDLDFPIKDALKLIEVLTKNYTFQEKNILFLKNPDREQL